MRNGILAAVIILCACSPSAAEVSRVAIPESAFSIVVVQDEKGLYPEPNKAFQSTLAKPRSAESRR